MSSRPPSEHFTRPDSGGVTDGFVFRLNAVGNGLVYSTFLGGEGDDVGRGIATTPRMRRS